MPPPPQLLLPTIPIRLGASFPSVAKRQTTIQRHPQRLTKQFTTSANTRVLSNRTPVRFQYIAPNRNMSSTAAPKKEFLVVVPDKKGALAKRNEVRDQHLTNVKPLVEAGTVSVGGALMDAHPENGEAPQMNGSMLVVEAESVQKARELLANDIYATHGVWDIENADIRPFRTAVRIAKN